MTAQSTKKTFKHDFATKLLELTVKSQIKNITASKYSAGRKGF